MPLEIEALKRILLLGGAENDVKNIAQFSCQWREKAFMGLYENIRMDTYILKKSLFANS